MQQLPRVAMVLVLFLAAVLVGSLLLLRWRVLSLQDAAVARTEEPAWWSSSAPPSTDEEPTDTPGNERPETGNAAQPPEGDAPSTAPGGAPPGGSSSTSRPPENPGSPDNGGATTRTPARAPSPAGAVRTPEVNLVADEETGKTPTGRADDLGLFVVRIRGAEKPRPDLWDWPDDLHAAQGEAESSLAWKAMHANAAGIAVGRVELTDRESPAGAVVFLDPNSPARAVLAANGVFVLPLTDEQCKTHQASGKLTFHVRLDGYRPVEGDRQDSAVTLRADIHGRYSLRLEPCPALEIRVGFSRGARGAKVWIEQRNEACGPLFDEHLYVCLTVPERGDVLFRLPSRGGNISVGLYGEDVLSEKVVPLDPAEPDPKRIRLEAKKASTLAVAAITCEEMTIEGEGKRLEYSCKTAAPWYRVELLPERAVFYSNAEGELALTLDRDAEKAAKKAKAAFILVAASPDSRRNAVIPRGKQGIFDSEKGAYLSYKSHEREGPWFLALPATTGEFEIALPKGTWYRTGWSTLRAVWREGNEWKEQQAEIDVDGRAVFSRLPMQTVEFRLFEGDNPVRTFSLDPNQWQVLMFAAAAPTEETPVLTPSAVLR